MIRLDRDPRSFRGRHLSCVRFGKRDKGIERAFPTWQDHSTAVKHRHSRYLRLHQRFLAQPPWADYSDAFVEKLLERRPECRRWSSRTRFVHCHQSVAASQSRHIGIFDPTSSTVWELLHHWHNSRELKICLSLYSVADCKSVKMPISNLSKIFGPTILGYSSSEPDQHAIFTETMIQANVRRFDWFDIWSQFNVYFFSCAGHGALVACADRLLGPVFDHWLERHTEGVGHRQRIEIAQLFWHANLAQRQYDPPKGEEILRHSSVLCKTQINSNRFVHIFNKNCDFIDVLKP